MNKDSWFKDRGLRIMALTRISLRNLLLVSAICPCLIWFMWKYDWISCGYYCSDNYVVNSERGYVCWVTVGQLQLLQIGEADGGYRQTELVFFTRHPYYHKTVLLSL